MYGCTQEIFTPVVLSGEEQCALHYTEKLHLAKERYEYRRAGNFPGVAENGHLAEPSAIGMVIWIALASAIGMVIWITLCTDAFVHVHILLDLCGLGVLRLLL